MNIHTKATVNNIPPNTTTTRSSLLLDELDTRTSMVGKKGGANGRLNRSKEYYEVWVGNLPFGTPRKILEDYIQQLMMMFFADCRQNPPTVNCAMNADHYLKCKRYAVLSLTSAEDAMRTIKFSGILFLQHKLHIRCTPPKNNAEETLITDNWSDLLTNFYLEGDESSRWYDDMELLWDTYATASISKFGQEFSEEVEYKGSAQQGEPTINPSLSTSFDNELVEREQGRNHRQLDYCIFDECSDEESSVESEKIKEVLLETIEGMDDDSIVLDEIRSNDTLQMVMGLVGSEELENPSKLPTQTIPPLNKSIWSEDISIINPGDRVTRERKEPQVNNGGTASQVTSSQQTPSVGNTTLWFDIHQFEGWNSPYDQITKPIDKATNRKDKEVYITEISKRIGKGSSNKDYGHQETKPGLATTTDVPSATSRIMGDNMSIAEVTIDSEIAYDHPTEQHPKKKKVHQSILQQQLGKLRMKSMIEVICHHQRVKKVLQVVSFWYLTLLHHMMVARMLGTTDYPREVLARSNQISQFFVPLNDGIFND